MVRQTRNDSMYIHNETQRTDKKKDISRKRTLRPTTGKVREAVFDIMRDRIRESIFLDLYAGTGAIGREALREGASEVFFVEASRGCARDIRKLVDKYGLSGKARIVNQQASPFIRWAFSNNCTFDIIFLDPPYHTDEILHILSALGESCILKKGGIILAEHFKKRQLPEHVGSLQKTRDYRYGDTVLSLYMESG